LHFDSLEEYRRAFNSPEGKRSQDDVKNFARKVTSVIVEENTIV
jgi:uncharacterized protein (TIGR02118 family)